MPDPVFANDISGKSALPKRSAAVSLAVHGAALLLAFLVGGPVTHFIATPHSTILVAPAPAPSVAPTPRRLPPPVLPTRAARLALPPQPAPLVKLPVIEIPMAPVVEPVRAVQPAPELARAIVPPTPPVPPIKTGEFTQALSATPKPAPQLSLQAAGFAAAENSRSSLPQAQLKTASGFDSAGVANQGPQHAVVSKSGFSDAAPEAASTPTQHAVVKSAFGDAAREAPTAHVMHEPTAASLTTPVDILSKPRPAYTAEARALGVEGEVLVEVVFEAGATVRVVRLVKGLGHGLDENALAAAREIRFRPARRAGIATDSTAIVHISFQLAY